MENRQKIRDILNAAGLRPTRQRLDLGVLLFTGEDWHLTAEMLRDDAFANNIRISLATIYNTLHQFTGAGLLREVAVSGAKTYFDTNTGDHHHFHLADNNTVLDIAHGELKVEGIPTPPEGMEVSQIDIVVHLRSSKSD